MNKLMIMIIAFAGIITGCSPTPSETPKNPKAQYKTITPNEAHTMMSESSGYILLDVRTPEEFEQIRIDGAVLIPDYELAERAPEELADQEQIILIYCRSGRRSADAASILAKMGYINVYDFGGINSWGHETVSGK